MYIGSFISNINNFRDLYQETITKWPTKGQDVILEYCARSLEDEANRLRTLKRFVQEGVELEDVYHDGCEVCGSKEQLEILEKLDIIYDLECVDQ